MTLFTLVPHPDHPPLAVTGIAVEVTGNQDEIELVYSVEGTDRLIVPDESTPARADDLWRTTCFELFLRPQGEDGYFEFNFSPSSRWAAYAFDGHRTGRADLSRPVDPFVAPTVNGVEVDCDLSGLPAGEMRMGLSAIIEEEGGRLSFWALAHPAGTADFHHADCFAATLPAVGRA